jgi:hypothetical protein
MEIEKDKRLRFWLRFSAADDYSEIFKAAVRKRPEAWIKRNQNWENHDTKNAAVYARASRACIIL